MILEYPGGELELRLNNEMLDQAIARSAHNSAAGVRVIIGDGGWDPATLTLSVRVHSPTSVTPGDGALPATDALVAAARTATCLREPAVPGDPYAARITYLHGLAQVRRRHRSTWWEVDIVFRPRALDGTRGTGELITYEGEVVTFGGLPVSLEVH